MLEVLGEEMPEEDAVRAYLQGPEEATTLSAEQQIVALDKLLECRETQDVPLRGRGRCGLTESGGLIIRRNGVYLWL